MKKVLFIFLLSAIVVGVSAQRKVRKETSRGDANYREQRFGAAEENYKKAIEMYSEHEAKASKNKKTEQTKQAFYNLGNTYYRQGRWDDAIEQYRNYQKLETDEINTSLSHRNIGDSYLRKAISDKAPNVAPQGGQQTGQMQMPQQEQLPRMEDLQNAMEAYKNALRMNPNDEETRYNLTTVQKMIQDQNDKNKDNKDNKDNKQDQDKQDDKKDEQKQDQDKKDDKKDKQDQQQQQENQMSQESMQQILKAMEQEEKETSAKVQDQKNKEKKKAQERNRQQNKDW